MTGKYLETDEADSEECVFFRRSEDTERYNNLKMPNEGEIDCVFSGYVYGGKVIFPFVSGLYARSLDGSLESCRASMI